MVPFDVSVGIPDRVPKLQEVDGPKARALHGWGHRESAPTAAAGTRFLVAPQYPIARALSLAVTSGLTGCNECIPDPSNGIGLSMGEDWLAAPAGGRERTRREA